MSIKGSSERYIYCVYRIAYSETTFKTSNILDE